jgi:polyisoprenyl-teichoic acid--peptidoglycan teichoic acid transferase
MALALSTVTTPPSGGPPPGSSPPVAAPPKGGLAKRVLAAALGVVLLAGATTYMLVRNELGSVVSALGQNRPIKLAPRLLVPTSKGAPETLLLVGNDERPAPTERPGGAVLPHSNEMLLVRIDPSKPTISMLSIPRELRVTFVAPSGEVITNRINSAYTYGSENGGGAAGGIKLMLETIKNVLGITVNHVFVTNFPKFRRAVDEMGCVYMTVDKRYYHRNEPGGEQYFEINLQPGYQRLCGTQALEFVANRHESTSLIRDARDQRFLLAVKAQYGPTLFEHRARFERMLGKALQTDLHGEEAVLQLLELLVESAAKPVRQVPFQVELHSSYDTATPQQLQASMRSFLTGTAASRSRGRSAALHAARPSHRALHVPGLSLTPTPAALRNEAAVAAPALPFRLDLPQYQQSTAESPPDQLRTYTIQGSGGRRFPAYVIVIGRGELGQYYDVQGTSWRDPPLLSGPSEAVRIGPRNYSLFYDGEHVKTVAWREHNAVYWIENTLTYSLSPQTIIAIAADTRAIGSPALPARAATTAPRGLRLSPPKLAGTSLSANAIVGLSVVNLAVVALLAVRLLIRQRELKLLREQIGLALAAESRERWLLAPATASAAGRSGADRATTALSSGRDREGDSGTISTPT